jgi:ubiquitin C-terminal hydrolase
MFSNNFTFTNISLTIGSVILLIIICPKLPKAFNSIRMKCRSYFLRKQENNSTTFFNAVEFFEVIIRRFKYKKEYCHESGRPVLTYNYDQEDVNIDFYNIRQILMKYTDKFNVPCITVDYLGFYVEGMGADEYIKLLKLLVLLHTHKEVINLRYLERNEMLTSKALFSANYIPNYELEGYPNIGNTCYMYIAFYKFRNSALSVLIRIPFYNFNKYLLNMYKYRVYADNDIIQSFLKLVALSMCDTHEPKHYNEIGQAMKTFKNIINNYYDEYSSYGQEDSPQFYQRVLNLLTEQFDKYEPQNNYKLNLPNNYIIPLEHSFKIIHKIKNYLINKNSIKTNPFKELYSGLIMLIFYCKCLHIGIKFEEFSDIVIYSYLAKNNELNLVNLVRGNFEMGEDQQGLRCSNCKRINRYEKRIIKLPRIMSVIIDRMNYETGRKDDKPIQDFDKIDLKEFVFKGIGIMNAVYEPYGTIIHYGGLQSGHYMS